MKRFLRSVGPFLVSTSVFLVTFEAGSFISIKAGWIEVRLPGYSLSGSDFFWKTVNPDFGVWHEPNDSMAHRTQCFDVTYTSNSFGMRDDETAKLGDHNRVVVLGDSFVEGWGVDYGKRFTDILEQKEDVEHLNFGTAGGFGSTQSYVLYKSFASDFSHDAVIFAILPDNDFGDDTPRPDDLAPGGRWRPFLVGSYPDYVLSYPAQSFHPNMRTDRRIEVFMEEFWVTYRVVKYYAEYFREVTKQNAANSDDRKARRHAGYYDYSEEQFLRLKYAIEQIKTIAGSRPMLIVTIPRHSDFERAIETGTAPPIRTALTALSAGLGVTYVDLMIDMGESPGFERYFHDCDGHWSNKGHAKAAEIIGEWKYFRHRP
jgi:hypothetical protein